LIHFYKRTMEGRESVSRQYKRKDTPSIQKNTQVLLQEMSLSNKEGDMLKLRIEEASEESSSEDDLQTQAETKEANPVVLRRKKTNDQIKIEVVENETESKFRKPSIMKMPSFNSLDLPMPNLQKRNSVSFDEMSKCIPSPPTDEDEESDEERQSDESDSSDEEEEAEDMEHSTHAGMSKLSMAVGTLKLKKKRNSEGEYPETGTPHSTPFGTPAAPYPPPFGTPAAPYPTPFGTPAPSSFINKRI